MTDTHPELTLSDVTWLTALARSLTRDGAEADDLVQETWIAASASPPADGAVNRAWLGRVLRNFHLKSLRSKDRRSRREQVASRAESQPSSADLVEAAELRRNLADGLLALPEPYRTTLMRVAFEGQTARQIAEVEGVSVGVVRHRLRKARELYKQELDRRCEGEGSRWYAALLPFADLPLPGDAAVAGAAGGVTAAAALGGLTVSIQTIVAVSAAALAGLFLWLLQEPSADPVDRGEVLEVGGRIVEQPTDFGSAASPPDRTPQSEPERPLPPLAAAVGTTDDDEAQTPGILRITGELIYRDELGALLPAVQSGHFSIEANDLAPSQAIAVKNGTFDFEVPSGWTMGLRRGATLEDRAAGMLAYDQTLGPYTEDTEITLEARRLAPIPIEALDADTGEHLQDVQLAWRGWMDVHPGAAALEKLQVDGEDSPFQVQLIAPRTTSFYVSAPGYPWTPLEIDPYAEGVRQVLLSQGSGALDVRIEGLAGDPCELTLWGNQSFENATAFEVGQDGVLRIERLAPGEYQLDAVSGEFEAWAEVALEAGEQEVTLMLQDHDVERVPLFGSLYLPAEWSLNDFTLELIGYGTTINLPSSELLRDEQNPSLWTFPTYEVIPGQLSARIEDIGWFTWFKADGGPVQLEVPLPQTVTLTVLDGVTGLPIDPETPDLSVAWATLSEGYRIGVTGIEYDPETQTWPFRAPLGPIGVYVRSPELDGEVELDLATHGSAVELSAFRTGHLVIDLFDGETEVAPSDGSWIYRCTLEFPDGTPVRISNFIQVDNEMHIQVSKPGLCTLKVTEVSGYAPIPDMQIEIKAGELLRHRIDLERE